MNTSSSTPSSITPAIESAAADWVTRCDAGLTAAEQKQFQAWQEEDSRHAEAYDHLKEAWSVFDRVEEGGVVGAVLAGLDQRARKRRKRRLQTGIAAATAAVIICWVGLWSKPGPELRPVVDREGFAGPLALSENIHRLPDGSVVELKAGSEIAVDYRPDARHVRLLNGEAFFRVAKDPARPFYVEANGIDVRAVGTAFSVKMRTSAVEIFVKEGAVDVGRAPEARADLDSTPDRRVVRVATGKRFIALIKWPQVAPRVDDAATVVDEKADSEAMQEPQTVTDEEMERQLAWRETLQEFDGNTLEEAVELLNHQNITQIVIRDPEVGRLRVSGYFRADNPEGLVRIMEGTFGLKAEQLDSHTILLRKED